MTPTNLTAFANELTKTASQGLGTMLGQRVTKTVKVKAKKAMKKKAGAMDAIRGLVAKGKAAAGPRAAAALEFAKKHPAELAGAAAGGLAAGEDHRTQGILGGALLGHYGNKLGRFAATKATAKRSAAPLANKRGASGKVEREKIRRILAAAGIGTAAAGSALVQREFRNERTAGAMEQPAMGTGKGVKKKLRKMAEDAGASVEDVLSEMMASSQARQDDQPFWADQGSTESESVDDPAYGHGKGLKGGKKRNLAPPFTDTFNPTDLPQAFGKKKASIAKTAALHFFGKTANPGNVKFHGDTGMADRLARQRSQPKAPLTDAQRKGWQGSSPVKPAPYSKPLPLGGRYGDPDGPSVKPAAKPPAQSKQTPRPAAAPAKVKPQAGTASWVERDA